MDKDIMELSVDNLAEKQLEFLKQHATNILINVNKLIQEEKFDVITKDIVVYSGSGDGYGDDNYYINFAYDGGYLDIYEIVDMMRRLRKVIDERRK